MSVPFIVLIDDDLDKRFLLKRYLGKQFPDHQIIAVDSYGAARAAVFTPHSKIVVTDGHIGGQDGIEYAAQIKRDAKAPVIMVSLREELRLPAIEAGVVAFVEPGDHEALHDAVMLALDMIQSEVWG